MSMVLTVKVMALHVLLPLEGKQVIVRAAVEMGLGNTPLKEGGLPEGGFTGLSLEVAQVLLEMHPTTDVRMPESARSGMEEDIDLTFEATVSSPPLSHRFSEWSTDMTSKISDAQEKHAELQNALQKAKEGLACMLRHPQEPLNVELALDIEIAMCKAVLEGTTMCGQCSALGTLQQRRLENIRNARHVMDNLVTFFSCRMLFGSPVRAWG
ncbi:hypothetical protein AAES_07135 [Amazona aestiva]|uniref:Uncharacterized protein n=1 Tax=Amazona aestiva TaxID=12930 RepID=A0A0Q3U2R2_AMAAE|nr:hypothetical protein AAES_07135 [Amazona aestiva]